MSTNSKSPKSQPKQQQRHRNLYKTSPDWRLIYKNQCLSRLNDKRNESRSRLIERFRNIDLKDNSEELDSQTHCIVDEVMRSVWDQFNRNYSEINGQDITDFMEDIKQELLLEEALYWENLLESREKEEIEWLVNNCLDS